MIAMEPEAPLLTQNGKRRGRKPGLNSTLAQRSAANARERSRMRVLSSAFVELKGALPWVPKDTKLSKLDTLKLAAGYIAYLKRLLDSSAPTQELAAANSLAFSANSGSGNFSFSCEQYLRLNLSEYTPHSQSNANVFDPDEDNFEEDSGEELNDRLYISMNTPIPKSSSQRRYLQNTEEVPEENSPTVPPWLMPQSFYPSGRFDNPTAPPSYLRADQMKSSIYGTDHSTVNEYGTASMGKRLRFDMSGCSDNSSSRAVEMSASSEEMTSIGSGSFTFDSSIPFSMCMPN
ncbi:Transcription factor 21 [Cichlidogyrus casuarinus]|uniref:Transcription factor 21 n=1 Tax=Cichlidogyrus casuarinus TaxID=1844966 RepID=A0ABD2QFP3_9PLAT